MLKWGLVGALLVGSVQLMAFGSCDTTSTRKNTVTEGDRQLNDQNKKAAEHIEKTSTDPAVVPVATDIKKNSGQLEENHGPPQDPKPYSPQNSEKSRDQSKQDHQPSGGWLGPVLTTVLGFFSGGAARAFGQALFPKFFGGTGVQVAMNLAEGIARAKEKIDTSPDKKIDLSTLLDVLGTVREKLPQKAQELLIQIAHEKEKELALRQ